MLTYCLDHFGAVVTDGRAYRESADPTQPTPLSIRGDIENGLPTMLDHLRDRQRRAVPGAEFRPALLLGPRMDSYSADTLSAFTDWCQAQHVRPMVARAKTGDSPTDTATALLADGVINAVHALNETYSTAVLAAADALGIEVPGSLQLSVRGNADTLDAEKRAAYLSMDPIEAGASCARLLIAQLEGEAPSDLVLPYRMVPAAAAAISQT